MGLSFHFGDPNKTLTDKNIDRIMQKLQKEFEQNFWSCFKIVKSFHGFKIKT